MKLDPRESEGRIVPGAFEGVLTTGAVALPSAWHAILLTTCSEPLDMIFDVGSTTITLYILFYNNESLLLKVIHRVIRVLQHYALHMYSKYRSLLLAEPVALSIVARDVAVILVLLAVHRARDLAVCPVVHQRVAEGLAVEGIETALRVRATGAGSALSHQAYICTV